MIKPSENTSASDTNPGNDEISSNFQQEMERMQEFVVCSRWAIVLMLWITIGLPSLWGLRSDIALWLDYFTWTAVRYALAYNHLPTLGLSLCIGMTAAVLVWQSRNILWGMPDDEKKRLKQQVYRIRQQGPSHPLWKFVCQSSSTHR